MSFYSSFKKIRWSIYGTALIDTFVVIFFTILPLIIGLILQKLELTPLDLTNFYKSGEIILYSLSLCVSSYLVYNQFSIKPNDLYASFSKILIVIIVSSSICYAVFNRNPSKNEEFCRMTSLFFILLAVPIFYFAQVTSNSRTTDVGTVRREEQDEIAENIQ